MSHSDIPFNKPCFVGLELWNITQAIQRMQISGDGYFTTRCQALLEQQLAADRVLLTTSCTHALEMSALLLDLGPGDEVIVPAFTFVSTANAFALRGARLVFADVREDTLNLDEERLEGLISERTRAIVPVHYAGVGCEMDTILAIAGPREVMVIEDNAHGLFGTYRGRELGTFGKLATLSFHETKNFTCGEGGALVVNDRSLLERAEIIREKGTDRSRFYRGQVDKYTWVDLGSSYPPSEILAAFLLAQLESRNAIQENRRRIWETYDRELAPIADAAGIGRPKIPPHCVQTFHMFYLVWPHLDARQRFIAHMKARGITCVFHYQSLHLSTMGRRYGGRPGDCPVSESASDRLVRLPFYNELSDSDQARIIEGVADFVRRDL